MKVSRLVLPVFLGSGAIIGIFLWGGLHAVVDKTNELAFCISCHEMERVYDEYRQSVHFRNAAGVRAFCADCHVPKAFWPKIIRKVEASNDIFHTLAGSIDTPEKFEARRRVLAERVWRRMEASDSRECRSCHSFEYMDFHRQGRRAARKMQKVVSKNTGETCIDCHKGIAHELPAGYGEDEDD